MNTRAARMLAGVVAVVLVVVPPMVVPVLAASAIVSIGDTLEAASLDAPPDELGEGDEGRSRRR